MTFIVYESATGIYLFQCKSPADLSNAQDYPAATRSAKIVKTYNFASTDEACAFMVEMAENKIPKQLHTLLSQAVPEKSSLIVFDRQLAGLLTQYQTTVDTGVHHTISQFFSQLTSTDPAREFQAQRALSHAFSRAVCMYDSNRDDQQIVQAIGCFEQIVVSANKYVMRLSECFGLHFPELRKLCTSNEQYVVLVEAIQIRKSILDKTITFEQFEQNCKKVSEENLIDVIDEKLLKIAFTAAQTSTGCDFSEPELMQSQMLCKCALKQISEKLQITKYLAEKLSQIAPNSQEILGTIQTARIIAKAGSLKNLAKSPASTIQLFGAEKALFRALKKRSNKTPKYGLIFNAGPVVAVKNFRSKGRVARTLACALARACRIDLYSETRDNKYGLAMKEMIESRVAFYNGTNKTIVKNMDVIRALYK
ncbi:Nop domain-containing protein [Spironucleus salmonicida]|uniref:Nop domain-containing protein n=1 Tax=Spironucleus salmonicida TaxID=348837 RepID=V6LVD8_9EUKA|nr:Nop domain-containing protein [Spironucleus salmonicida]|eukprot:EST48560.1 Nucleolar protein NOP5 [Spironucleus salmonicida]